MLNSPLLLPCGATIKHRLAKSAMSDSLGNGEGKPTWSQIKLYERWAQGGAALSIIGEVQCDPSYPEAPGNLVLNEHTDLAGFKALAEKATINQSHIWPQIGHAGAMSYPAVSRPRGPSALEIGEFKCDELSVSEIRALPEIFAKSALLAKQCGFTGIQLHAAHGFLLSQFLSPLFNRRSDQYGGSTANRSRIILEIIESIRSDVGRDYPIGIKINAADQIQGGIDYDEAIEVISLFNKTSVDLIDISGGTYFPGATSSSDRVAKGPYFLDFARMARTATDKPLMLTGGFKKREQATKALKEGAIDMVGMARAWVIRPDIANLWLSDAHQNPIFPRFESPPEGGITACTRCKLPP